MNYLEQVRNIIRNYQIISEDKQKEAQLKQMKVNK